MTVCVYAHGLRYLDRSLQLACLLLEYSYDTVPKEAIWNIFIIIMLEASEVRSPESSIWKRRQNVPLLLKHLRSATLVVVLLPAMS